MKKAYNKIKLFMGLCFVLCLIFFNTNCGLDVYYVIDPPYSIIHSANYVSIDQSERYFEFWTNNSAASTEGFNYKGTEIYYKIYNNKNTMTSEVAVVQQLANDTEKSASSYDRLESYKYSPLRCNGSYNEPLIPSDSSNQKVYIRLTDFQNIEAYSARILINDKPINGMLSNSIPCRNTSDRNSFNFGRSGGNNRVPYSDDSDTRYGSASDGSKWFVALFAVGVGHDANYANYHSAAFYLGSVTIDSASADN